MLNRTTFAKIEKYIQYEIEPRSFIKLSRKHLAGNYDPQNIYKCLLLYQGKWKFVSSYFQRHPILSFYQDFKIFSENKPTWSMTSFVFPQPKTDIVTAHPLVFHGLSPLRLFQIILNSI